MWRTTASTTGTGGTTLRAGGCRGDSSIAGACSPLASTGMSRCRWITGFFPLSDQKDSYAVVLVVMTHPCQVCSSSSSSTEWSTFLFYGYGFGRPSLEREVQWGVRVHSSSCGAHRDVVHSPFEWLHHRRHCNCRDLVLFVGRLPWLCCPNVLRRCLRRDVVWWWRFHS